MRTIRQSGQQGVTILETVITLTIIGILASVAVVLYVGQLPQARLNGAARQVMSDLMMARRQAVSRTRQVNVYFRDGQQYKICYEGDDDCNPESEKNWKDLEENYSGVTITPPYPSVTFRPRGTIRPLGASIGIKNASGSRSVRISSVGRIRIDSEPE